MPQAGKLTIGQVLNVLKGEFPDMSISTIRFWEEQGLVSPEREASRYRRYSDSDIERLRYIARVKRDQYLPLKVIRDNLEMMDRGEQPPTEIPVPVPAQSQAAIAAANATGTADPIGGNKKPLKLSRRQLLQTSGLSEATLIELERQKMIAPRKGSIYYGREALTVCVVARKLQAFGLDSRHMRVIKQAAEREAGLVEQTIRPALRAAENPGRAIHELSRLVVHAHAAMMYTLLEG
ncbi:hypothetical protein HMPREF1531_02166 [Propionibacterium sp. oral taxon 192 str. F0372]|uniref:transcriptional regulator FtsR n=1 Tax=Propionibacterium sp. oral taxon 192 TaxID=671222 RepID=UPI000352F14E|nr:MerR family transcriptional regulator [Propionibacterium sp. oral taxon 192]EPH02854.1 hypothetical protein HMPREF1531_02166 [Propionibacterium sp. oral taxon 192 str. F0372]